MNEQATFAVPPVARMQPQQLGAVCRMLARAFHDDPIPRYTLPNERYRQLVQPWVFRFLLQAAPAHQIYVTSGRVLGAAAWMPPGATMRANAVLWAVPVALMLGWRGGTHMGELGHYTDRMRRRDAPTGHWYLNMLGVEPAYQGRGIGAALLAPVLREADVAGQACYLETATERDVQFYQKFGFYITSAGGATIGGPLVWGMLRPAAT